MRVSGKVLGALHGRVGKVNCKRCENVVRLDARGEHIVIASGAEPTPSMPPPPDSASIPPQGFKTNFKAAELLDALDDEEEEDDGLTRVVESKLPEVDSLRPHAIDERERLLPASLSESPKLPDEVTSIAEATRVGSLEEARPAAKLPPVVAGVVVLFLLGVGLSIASRESEQGQVSAAPEEHPPRADASAAAEQEASGSAPSPGSEPDNTHEETELEEDAVDDSSPAAEDVAKPFAELPEAEPRPSDDQALGDFPESEARHSLDEAAKMALDCDLADVKVPRIPVLTTFHGSGRAVWAAIAGSAAKSSSKGCILGGFRELTVTPFRGEPVTLETEITLPK